MIFKKLAFSMMLIAVGVHGRLNHDDSTSHRRLGTPRRNDPNPGRCNEYTGSGLQKFTALPTNYPNSALPGERFVSVVDKPLLENVVDFGINTCEIVTLGPPVDEFPTYELSCHLLAKSADADGGSTFTASGDGASNLLFDAPQQSLYAITGGTGKFFGAWGEMAFDFDTLVFDEEIGKFVSTFDFKFTVCV